MKYLSLLFLFCVSCASMPWAEKKPVVPPKPSYSYNQALYDTAKPSETSIKISLWDQKAWLLNKEGEVILETDVSTGVDGKETSARVYKVLEKKKTKRSTKYGQYVKKDTREVVVEKSWEHVGKPPKGTEYQGIVMPYWMRLTWYGVGMHVGGFKKRTRSSFGCIRVVKAAQPYIYEKTKIGTKVEVVEESLKETLFVAEPTEIPEVEEIETQVEIVTETQEES